MRSRIVTTRGQRVAGGDVVPSECSSSTRSRAAATGSQVSSAAARSGLLRALKPSSCTATFAGQPAARSDGAASRPAKAVKLKSGRARPRASTSRWA